MPYSAQCTPLGAIEYTAYTPRCYTVHSVHPKVIYSTQCTLGTIQYTVYTARFNTVQYTVYTVPEGQVHVCFYQLMLR